MATVILLRHGRTSANAGGTLAGHQPTELDDAGHAQAVAVGERLRAAGVVPDLLVSSPLIRCRQTVAAAFPGASVVDEPDLVECDYGDWSGQPLKTLAKEPLWKVIQAHPSAAVFPGGESMAAMATRAVAAARAASARASAEHGDGAIVVACSHGDVIKAIVADALGLHLDLFQRLTVDPASLSIVRYTQLRPFLVRLNDVGGELSSLKQPRRRGRTRRASSDAVLGGGAGTGAVGTGAVGTAPGGGADNRIRSDA